MKLADKDYKRAIKNMFKDLKEMVTILSDQMGNLSIEMGKKKGRKEREKERRKGGRKGGRGESCRKNSPELRKQPGTDTAR